MLVCQRVLAVPLLPLGIILHGTGAARLLQTGSPCVSEIVSLEEQINFHSLIFVGLTSHNYFAYLLSRTDYIGTL